MGIVVYRRPAGVHLHQLGIIGNEQFLLVGQRIIKIHIGFLQSKFYKKPPLAPVGTRGG
jgi:hypothetical protein